MGDRGQSGSQEKTFWGARGTGTSVVHRVRRQTAGPSVGYWGERSLSGVRISLPGAKRSPSGKKAGRLEKDIEQGLRDEDVVNRSLARLPFYEKLNTIKIDTTGCSPKMVAERITKASGRKRWDS